LLKELCSRDYHSKQSSNIALFDIQDIYHKTFKDIEKKQFLKFLTWFAQDFEYIQFLLQNKIALILVEIIASSLNNINKNTHTFNFLLYLKFICILYNS
jgi:hypothetical protein